MTKLFPSKFVFLFLLIFSNWAQADTTFSQVYVFGDSLSDTGNLASVIGDFPAPYYMNRVSNGPVAVETLAAQLGHAAEASLHLIGTEQGSNYAVAGANAFGNDAIDLNTQIISFQANHGFVAPSDALYVILIGGNDIRSARDSLDWTTAQAIVQNAALEVRQAIESLSLSGARSFMLINSPNIALLPETQLIASVTANPRLVKHARKLSNLYRVKLHAIAEQLEDDRNIKITEFDLFKFFNKLVKKAERYGFSNATEACFSPDIYPTTLFHPDCDFDQFIFFDEIHPTARTHALVGEAFYKALNEDDD